VIGDADTAPLQPKMWSRLLRTKIFNAETQRRGEILKGLNHSARRCEERATPGNRINISSTLKGLHQFAERDATPLGLKIILDD